MVCLSFRCSTAVAVGMVVLLLFGCAPATRMELPEPIARSPEEMPPDAARVAAAIQARITGAERGTIEDVRFEDEAEQRLTRTRLQNQALALKRSELYLHQMETDNPTMKRSSGRLEFEGPLGRRATVFYVTTYSHEAKGLFIREVRVAPVYSDCPEPMMFVVPGGALPQGIDAFPNTYLKLLRFVGERAVDSTRPASVPREKADYVIFVFLLDRIAPSSKFEVKVSDTSSGTQGYKAATRYIDFNGWRVALLPGRFILFDDQEAEPLYVKAVFTPGTEVSSLKRAPRLVGLYCMDGTRP
jgi:hypothetical protein